MKTIITDISRMLAKSRHPSAPLASRGGAGKRKLIFIKSSKFKIFIEVPLM
jgi:hypothetical protein